MPKFPNPRDITDILRPLQVSTILVPVMTMTVDTPLEIMLNIGTHPLGNGLGSPLLYLS